MSIFLQFSVKIIQPIRHCKASKGGLFYVKPPSSLLGLNLPKQVEAMFNDSAVNEKKGRADMCQAGVRISGRGKNLNNCLNYFWRRFICYAAVTRIRFKQHSFAARGWTSKREPQSQVLKTMRGYVVQIFCFLLKSELKTRTFLWESKSQAGLLWSRLPLCSRFPPSSSLFNFVQLS